MFITGVVKGQPFDFDDEVAASLVVVGIVLSERRATAAAHDRREATKLDEIIYILLLFLLQ